ncbi:MAG: hypothetical protein HYV27_01865 [Candidatus Hydrogenedentes bacterium]|nr:hypothetical protein [Candidatus Hydrogenedentota bacterium]
MKKVVAIGELHSFLCWRVAGCHYREADSATALAAELMHIVRDPDVALVLVPGNLAAGASQALEDFRAATSAVLMVLPDDSNTQDAGYVSVRRSVERALGVDMLGDIE